MSTRTITVAAFAALFVLAAVLVVAARIRPERFASFPELVAHLGRRRITRIAVLAVWAWLGWHFLAR